jgi:hypothetical protein
MGRLNKEGLDYYPVYVDFEDNDKISMILAECGMLGEIVIQRLWRSIYRNKGYYYEFGTDECLLMSRRIGYGLKSQEIMEVVQTCLRRNLFDMRLYKDYGILTSKRIQEIYVVATAERISVKIDQRFMLIQSPKRANITVYNPDLSAGNPPTNGIYPPNPGGEIQFPGRDSTDKKYKSPDKFTKESKGKESRVEESKVEESEDGAPQITLFSKDYFKIEIQERKEIFRGAVISYYEIYESSCVDKFFVKWSEFNPTRKRMRFELERTWDLEERIGNWGAAWNEIESKKEKNTGSRMNNNMNAATQALRELMAEKQYNNGNSTSNL